jgi:hypothetical protein
MRLEFCEQASRRRIASADFLQHRIRVRPVEMIQEFTSATMERRGLSLASKAQDFFGCREGRLVLLTSRFFTQGVDIFNTIRKLIL